MGKGSVKSNRRPTQRPAPTSRYNQRTLIHDREYGFYWYAWLWKILRPLLTLAISLVVVLGIVSSGWTYVNGHFFMPVNPEDTQVREFVIHQGDSITKIGENLYNQGYIRNKGVFKYMVQFQELTAKIQYGSYPLSSSMDINQVLGIISQGVASNERTITVIPGWTVKDIANYLVKQDAVTSADEFEKTCGDANLYSADFSTIQDIVDSKTLSGRKIALEGYLAPDTYQVYKSATAESIVRTLLKQSETVYDRVFNTEPVFDSVVDEAGNKLDSDGNIITEEPPLYESTLTRDQTIILASMIEKEAGKVADYRKVSAVFHNRLLKGMRLESDAAISYALGISRLVLTSDELQTKSPYNTYLNAGLPVGPICNPSEKALLAALYPDIDYVYDEYLFFCATDPAKGELWFSKTKEEHDAAVAEYRPLWIEHDRKQAANN